MRKKGCFKVWLKGIWEVLDCGTGRAGDNERKVAACSSYYIFCLIIREINPTATFRSESIRVTTKLFLHFGCLLG